MRPILTLVLGLVLAFVGAGLSSSTPPAMPVDSGSAAFFLQATTTPQFQDRSEIGSTDGIVIMGILIALIVIIPILLRRQSWMESR